MSFESDIKGFIKKVEKRTDQVIRGSSLQLFGDIVLSTPVGNPKRWNPPREKAYIYFDGKRAPYIGGRLRGNWNLSTGQPDSSTTDNPDPSGAKNTIKATTAVRQHRGRPIYISNHLPYAKAIEEGHGINNRPGGMVRKNVKRWKKIVKGNIPR